MIEVSGSVMEPTDAELFTENRLSRETVDTRETVDVDAKFTEIISAIDEAVNSETKESLEVTGCRKDAPGGDLGLHKWTK